MSPIPTVNIKDFLLPPQEIELVPEAFDRELPPIEEDWDISDIDDDSLPDLMTDDEDE